MKTFLLRIIVLFCLFSTPAFSQNKLYIELKSGTKITFLIDSVNRITFEGLSLLVNKIDGSFSRFNVYDINHISSVDMRTSSIVKIDDLKNKTVLYPNPAIDQIIVSFESKTTGKAQLDICNSTGNVLLQKSINSVSGINYVLFRIDELPEGAYLCVLHHEDHIETIKFIKQ